MVSCNENLNGGQKLVCVPEQCKKGYNSGLAMRPLRKKNPNRIKHIWRERSEKKDEPNAWNNRHLRTLGAGSMPFSKTLQVFKYHWEDGEYRLLERSFLPLHSSHFICRWRIPCVFFPSLASRSPIFFIYFYLFYSGKKYAARWLLCLLIYSTKQTKKSNTIFDEIISIFTLFDLRSIDAPLRFPSVICVEPDIGIVIVWNRIREKSQNGGTNDILVFGRNSPHYIDSPFHFIQ